MSTHVSSSDHGRGRAEIQLRAWIEHIRADVKAGLTPYDSSFDEAMRLIDQMAVPEGYRLVPIKPTDRMMLMGGFRFAGKVPNSEVFKEVRKGWDDMLSVAPEPCDTGASS